MLQSLDDARESAVRLIDYVLKHSDAEASTVDAAFLLQAAHELALQEKADTLEVERLEGTLSNAKLTKEEKAAAKAEKQAMKQAEKEAEAAAREVAEAANRTAAAAVSPSRCCLLEGFPHCSRHQGSMALTTSR